MGIDPNEIELLEAVIDAIPGLVSYWDQDLHLRVVNDAYVKWWQVPNKEALLGRTMQDILGEPRFRRVEPRIRAALAGERQEFETVTYDAAQWHVNMHVVPHVRGGHVQGIAIAVDNVTHSHEARLAAEALNELLEERVRERTAALKASEERLATVIRSSPMAIGIRRLRDERLIEVNDHFAKLTGFSREELLGRTSLESGLETNEIAAKRRDHVTRHERDDGSVRDLEVPYYTKSGERRIALTSLEPITLENEGPCILGAFVDVTERKAAQQRLEAQYEMSRVLAQATSLGEAAPKILQLLCEVEGWDVGAIWQIVDEGERRIPVPRDIRVEATNHPGSSARLRPIAVWHVGGRDKLGPLVAMTETLTLGRGQGGPGLVWESGETCAVVDVTAEPRYVRAAAAREAGLKTAIAFPIRHGDKISGVIDFVGNRSVTDPKQHEFLAAIGTQTGLFVERTHAASLVRRNEEQLQSVIDGLSEGLVMLSIPTKPDGKGTLLHFNPAAVSLYGFGSAEDFKAAFPTFQFILDKRALDGTPVPAHDGPFARALRGETFRDFECRIRRRDKDVAGERALSFGASVVSQDDGTKIAVVTVRDISERLRREELRRMTEELLEDNRRIQEASRLKSEFLANMSHELRTPLNAIIGFSALIHAEKAGAVSPAQKEYLGDVLTSAKHLLQLINDVLDLAKVESGHVDVATRESVDSTKAVKEVEGVLRGLASEKELRIDTSIDPSLGMLVTNERILKQILYNYLSNAIKFTPHGGSISIRLIPDQDETSSCRLEVEDTGIGIREEDAPRLFVEFQQLDSGASKRYQGTGLGLALVKKGAEALGGRAGVSSTLGKGSCFYVVLPKVLAAA